LRVLKYLVDNSLISVIIEKGVVRI